MKNLSIEAKEHLREASKSRVRAFLDRQEAIAKRRRKLALLDSRSSGAKAVERAFA